MPNSNKKMNGKKTIWIRTILHRRIKEIAARDYLSVEESADRIVCAGIKAYIVSPK